MGMANLRAGPTAGAAQTFAAWSGSGLRLWAFTVPSSVRCRSSPARTSCWAMTRRAT